MAQAENFFALPASFSRPDAPEFVRTVLSGENGFRVERIVSNSHVSPEGFWYDQDEDEWCLVLEGSAVLAFDDGRTASVSKGESLFLPAHCRHRVAFTSSPCVWLCIFGIGLSLGL